MSAWNTALQRLIWLVFGFTVVEGLFGVPYESWELVFAGRYPAVGVAAGILTAALGIVLAFRYRDRVAALAETFVRAAATVSARSWLAGILVAGIALRLVWIWLYPPDVQVSDMATYVTLGAKLARGEPYYTGGTWSYWPPGYPLFLLPGFALFGVRDWVIGLANVLLYAGTVIVTWHLAREMAGESAARIATALVCIWPNHVMASSLAMKEILLVFLVPLSLFLYLRAHSARERRRSLLYTAASGAVLGATSLTQPALMVLPSVMICYELATGRQALAPFLRVAVLVASMVLVIAPWTARNFEVLGAFVPITTTGGDNFYSANNALATGTYIPKYERDLGQFDELTANRMGYQWAKEWIGENPGRFATLMLRKQIYVMADDSAAPYWTLKAGRQIGDVRFIAVKGLCNIFWLVMLWCILVALVRAWPPTEKFQSALLPMLVLLCIWTVHSVFQAGGRHHMPIVPALAILVGSLAAVPRRPLSPH